MIVELKGLYFFEQKPENSPVVQKVTISYLDPNFHPDFGVVMHTLSFRCDKLKFDAKKELPKYLDKKISIDVGNYNGARYGVNIDLL